MKLDINDSELIKYTDKLESISRKALPYAVKNTLNNAAFDMKKTTLHKSVKSNFKGLKAPMFFKRYSGVNKANAKEIDSMVAMVGMLDMGNPSIRTAIENMEKQEFGGIIDDGFAYLKDSRAGSNLNKFVRKPNYYDKNKVISGRSKVGRGNGSVKSKFVARAYKANKERKPMFINSMRGNFLAEVRSFRKTKKGKVKIKMRLLMKERDRVNIKATNFMQEAGLDTQKKIPNLYIKEIEKQISRLK